MNITPFPTLSPATIDAINVIGQWLAQDDFSGEGVVSGRLRDPCRQCGYADYRRGM